jgi:hypothetical protein
MQNKYLLSSAEEANITSALLARLTAPENVWTGTKRTSAWPLFNDYEKCIYCTLCKAIIAVADVKYLRRGHNCV